MEGWKERRGTGEGKGGRKEGGKDGREGGREGGTKERKKERQKGRKDLGRRGWPPTDELSFWIQIDIDIDRYLRHIDI
jgi:hypothetical protein